MVRGTGGAMNILNSAFNHTLKVIVRVVNPTRGRRPKITISSSTINVAPPPKTLMQRASETTVLLALTEYVGSLAGTFRAAYYQGWFQTQKKIIDKYSPVEVEDEENPSVKTILKKILAEQEILKTDVLLTKNSVKKLEERMGLKKTDGGGKKMDRGGKKMGGSENPEKEEGESTETQAEFGEEDDGADSK